MNATHDLNLRLLRYREGPAGEHPARLAEALWQQDRLDEAIEFSLAELSQAARAEDLELLRLAARLLMRAGRYHEAQVGLMRVIACDPTDVEAWSMLAGLLVDRGQLARARRAARRGLALQSDHPELRAIHRSVSLRARGRRFCHRLEGEEPAMLARELLTGGLLDDALEVTRSALTQELDDIDLLVAHAEVSLRRGNLDEAVGALRTATYEAPDWPDVWVLLARTLREHGDDDEARDAANRARTLAPTRPDVAALSLSLGIA